MELLTDKEYQLERFPGKGGWTYVALPDIPKDKEAAFGIVKVRGTIDDYELNGISLMPMANNTLLLSVKAEIRKKIGKEEGDFVHVKLYRDTSAFEIRDDFKQRLLEQQGAYELFIKYRQWEQRMCIDWIYAAKRPETTEERIKKTIGRILRHEKLV